MRSVIVLLFSFLLHLSLFSQTYDNAKFLTIGRQSITTEEFERVFNKNNSISTSGKQSVEEYLDMFINFKLKVQAAMDAGLDTTAGFRNELKGYRDQLARTYLTDNSAVDSLILEAYNRMHTEVSAAHIMTALKINATPSDTLAAWNKIMEIRKRLINGESFEQLAWELSEDPSAKHNRGNLGYFTAFQMVYPFESAAYNGKIGDISMPVRSRFGYHLVKTTDKRPASGEVKVAHIMLMVPQGAPDSAWVKAEKKIREMETELKKGADFAALARERSEDKGSARNGGELPAFGAGRMVPEFEAAAFQLQTPGEISTPVKTFYGWHIIKLIEKKGIPEFDEIKYELKSRISRDERAEYGSNSFIAQLQKEYRFEENPALLASLYTVEAAQPRVKTASTPKKQPGSGIKSAPAQTVVQNHVIAPSAEKGAQVLFSFAAKSFTLNDFYNHLAARDTSVPASEFIQKSYHAFVKKALLDYENSQLENKHPDFRHLIQEYHDGILLFNLSDSLVWSRASRDSAGLKKFFARNQSKYMWPERLEATLVTGKSLPPVQQAYKTARKSKTPVRQELVQQVCDSSATEPCITVQYDKFSKGENALIDQAEWKKGTSKIISTGNGFHFVVVYNLLKPSPKTLDETRGIAVSDYQEELDKLWIKDLRIKYEVSINKEIMNYLKSKYAGKN